MSRFIRRNVVLLACFLASSHLVAQSSAFRRGDSNQDDALNLTDAIHIAERLFLTTEGFLCEDSVDVNDDGQVNLTDVIGVVGYLFLDEQRPPPPLDECGDDPTEDSLGCEEFPSCELLPDLCLSDETVDEIFGDLELDLGFEFCLPAGLLNVPVEAFEVAVCPEEDADPECGALETAGCPITFQSVSPVVDIENGQIGLSVSGRIEDLPIAVTESLFNSTTVCENTFHGEDGPDSPFSFDIILPLIIEEVEPGVREIVGVGESEIGNVNIELDSSGGLVCTLFGAVDGVLIDVFLLPLSEALSGLTENLPDELVGLRICEEE